MRQRRSTRIVGVIFAFLIVGYLVLPALAVIPMAFSSSSFLEFPPPGFSTKWIEQFFADPAWTAALTRSLVVAASAAVIAVPLGTLAAYAMVRANSRTSRATDPILMMPMMVPVVISGFALYVMVLMLRIQGGLPLVVLAHVGLAIPFVVTTVTASLRTFDFKLVQAARVHGASATRAFLGVVVPVIAPGIAAATLLSIMVSLDEPVIAMFVAGDREPTLPVKMFASITYELNPVVPVAATVLTLATFLLLGLSLALTAVSRRRAAA
ncbi:ABC transporter permease [Leucobacter rhizosphaerae]|uniref:ABC transporter permease n=1 Tax=Leucobacter rhizosphaerae TaxID=2932245 RepID=A0ABY4FTK7_9MICO|nr:ABC transporter permease [Leucobacter rhizosphaerae]UOQ59587.1 ABC transporter permease [Leucobacter rhizosphaerae]